MEKQPRYSGGIETRTESDATNFELRRCYEAAKKLKKTGTLIPVDGKKFYHGRAKEGGQFAVDPFYDNTGNKTGNNNVNSGAPVLHVATGETAREFAEARARHKGTVAEVVEIEIADQDASFFDASQPRSAREGHMEEIREGLAESLPDPISGTILSMEDYKSLDPVAFAEFRRLATNREVLFNYDDNVSGWAKKLNISEEGARRLIGSINARNSILQSDDPHRTMADILSRLTTKKRILVLVPKTRDGKKETTACYINREYILQWMKDMHIIGYKRDIDSATLDRNLTDSYQIIQMEEAKGKEQAEAARESRMRVFGGATYRVHRLLTRSETARDEGPLKCFEMDRRVTPRDLIDSAKRVGPQFKELFEGDSGVWEGFTVEQHTETTLRGYDASYKSSLPRSIYDFGRLCLLVHDIGKSAARKEKRRQSEANAQYSKEFLQSIGAPAEFVEAIPLIITEGMTAAAGTILRKTPESQSRLWLASREIAKKLFNIDERSPDYKSCVKTIYHLCRVLMECDGAAYGTHAITRGTKGGGIQHFNNNPEHDEAFKFSANNPEYHRVKE